ncbi:MAG: hypothetical protein Q8P49_01510 [Candidatus Liptonbacteria bacterium]|nr:hypothetical protein [Candidatus Liptonbacteria bacterium]
MIGDQIIGKIPSQNLIKQVNIESPYRKAGFWKPVVLDVFTLAAALGAGYAYSQYLSGAIMFSWLLLAIGVYAAISTLHVFFTRDFSRRLLVLILETAAFLAFFYQINWWLLVISAGAILILCVWGYLAGRFELDNGLDIRFFRASVPFLKKFTTAMVLALVTLYLSQWNANHLFLSHDNFQKFFDWASGLASGFYPGITFNSSFGELARSIARAELQGDPNFSKLTSANQDMFVGQTAEQIAATFSKTIGSPISPSEPTENVLYNFIISTMDNWKAQFQNWFFAIWAVIVFLAIRAFGLIFYWLVAILSFIFYQILLAAGFVHIIGESRTHEVVVY